MKNPIYPSVGFVVVMNYGTDRVFMRTFGNRYAAWSWVSEEIEAKGTPDVYDIWMYHVADAMMVFDCRVGSDGSVGD